MKTIRIFIKGNFNEGYIYGGQLFVIQNGGNVFSTPLWSIISENLNPLSEEFNFFKLIFSRNNWLKNEQGNSFFEVKRFKEEFKKLWVKYSKVDYTFTLNNSRLNNLGQVSENPTLDFQIYGMRMFVGDSSGLYESGFSLNQSNEVKPNKSFARVFDGRATSISPKSGSIMISSNTDGLFHGQMLGINQKLFVKEKPISNYSLRTGWSGYDVVNYDSQKNFDYLKSEFRKTEERKYLYKDEADTQKISIDNVGAEIYSFENLLQNSKIKEEEIIYSFNSSTNCFFFLNDGRLQGVNFIKEIKNGPIRLSSKNFQLPPGLKKDKYGVKPISTKIVLNGCVVEYFDQVLLIKNNIKTVLENNPVIAVKTYPGSVRYKNIITIFTGDGVAIHSMYPFDE